MFEHDNRRPRSALGRLLLRGLRRWQRQRAMDELQAMDDRDLWDIGLTRNDIPRAVERPVQQEVTAPHGHCYSLSFEVSNWTPPRR
ncbi:DUF1127 domain-containing protein [Neoaquamicrobium sediminum]|uniref:DUF1127 domain-containing protein n=1 Tax=Neoaquamicrobium sediminum TaxID=1849104 RepID=A0ABV3X062_9HYPH